MADNTSKAIGAVNSISPVFLLIGGVVVIGALAAYEILKGGSSSANAGTTTSATNPVTSQPVSTNSSIPISISPIYLPTANPTTSSGSRITASGGSYVYNISSVYAPYTSTSLVYSPITTTTSSATTTNNNQRTSQVTTSNNQKYTYSTAGAGSGIGNTQGATSASLFSGVQLP